MKFWFIFIIVLLTTELAFGQNYNAIQSVKTSNPGFVQNIGQVIDVNGKSVTDIQYYINYKNLTVYFQRNSINFVFQTMSGDSSDLKSKAMKQFNPIDSNGNSTKPDSINLERIDLVLNNTSSDMQLIADEKRSEYYNYYLPNVPRENSKSFFYNKIIYKNIYKGIDLVWYVNNGNLSYRFVVNNNSNLSDIDINIEGATECIINNEQLIINGNLGTISLNKSILNLEKVNDKYSLKYNKKEKDNKNQLLAIYNQIVWSTFLGGTRDDYVRLIIFDTLNNGIVIGGANPYNFPLTTGTIQSKINGTTDYFIMKFNCNESLIWGTYIGSFYEDDDYGAAIDKKDNSIWICGKASGSDFPTTSNAYSRTIKGYDDGIIVKISSSGNLLYSTYMGGTQVDIFRQIAVDTLQNAWVTGITYSTDFPIVGTPQKTTFSPYDALIVKVDKNGNILYSSNWGGSENDYGVGVAIDSDNNPVFSGYTTSIDFPVTSGCFQYSSGGNNEAYIAKFSQSCQMIWGTYFGASNDDYGSGIACDHDGNIALRGYTNSKKLSITSGCFQDTLKGGVDNFIAKFTPDGNLIWATYYGGSQDEDGFAKNDQDANIAVNNENLLAITGFTHSIDLFTSDNALQKDNNGSLDAFTAIFNSNGGMIYSSYIGGSKDDRGFYINFDNNDTLYLVGDTYSSDFPIIGNSYQNTYSGRADGFIVKFDTCKNIDIKINAPSNLSLCQGESVTLSISSNYVSYFWYRTDSLNSLSNTNKIIITSSGNYYAIARNQFGCYAFSDTVNIIFRNNEHTTLSVASSTFCLGESATLTAPNSYTNYQWYKLPSSNCLSNTYTLITQVSGKYYLTAINQYGCRVYSDTINIAIKPFLIETITIAPSSGTFCKGDSSSIYAKKGFQNYQWFKTDSKICLSNNDSLFVNKAGKYYVTATDSYGCTISSNTVTVEYFYNAIFNLSYNITKFCLGDSITVYAKKGMSDYKWYKLDSTAQLSSNDYLVIKLPGKYYAIGKDKNGCKLYSDTVNVTVYDNSPYTLQANTTMFCKGDSVTIFALEGLKNYEWYKLNSAGNCLSTKDSLVVNQTGKYYVIAYNKYGCLVNSDTITLTATDHEHIALSIGSSTFCQVDSVTISVLKKYNNCQWFYLDSSASSPLSVNDSIIINKAGKYYIIASTKSGCPAYSDTISISFGKIGNMAISTNLTTICQGDSTELFAPKGYNNYQWYRLSTGSCLSYCDSLLVKRADKYYVIAKNNNGCPIYSDTISISISSDKQITLSTNSNTFCQGDSTTIFALKGLNNYQWFKVDSSVCLSTNDSIIVKQYGKYYLIANINSGCPVYSDTVSISVRDTIHIRYSHNSYTICYPDEIVIREISEFTNFHWYCLDSGSVCLSSCDSLKIRETGKYYFIATSSWGCPVYSDTTDVIVYNSESIKLSANTSTFCEGDSIILFTNEKFSKYYWIKIDSIKKVMSKTDSIVIKESGKYYFLGINQHGCTVYSDTINITSMDNSGLKLLTNLTNGQLSFGKLYYAEQKCLPIIFEKIGNDTLILNNLSLINNTVFSIPQTQFPKTFLPKKIDSIFVCFSPKLLEDEYDTLYYNTKCDNLIIPLIGSSDLNTYEGTSKCHIPIKVVTQTFPSNCYQYFSEPKPNPGTDFIKISYESYIPDNLNVPIKAELFDIFGNTVCTALITVTNQIQKDTGKIITGEYIFDTKELSNGSYFIKVANPYEINTWNVIILK